MGNTNQHSRFSFSRSRHRSRTTATTTTTIDPRHGLPTSRLTHATDEPSPPTITTGTSQPSTKPRAFSHNSPHHPHSNDPVIHFIKHPPGSRKLFQQLVDGSLPDNAIGSSPKNVIRSMRLIYMHSFSSFAFACLPPFFPTDDCEDRTYPTVRSSLSSTIHPFNNS